MLGKDLDQNRELVNSVMQGRNYMVQVDQTGKIKQIIDTGANGDGSDPLQPAAAANAVLADVAVASVELPINYEGQQAIDFLGAELPKVAGGYGLAPEKLREMLLSDDSLRIDGNNRMFYVDQDSGNPAPANRKPPAAPRPRLPAIPRYRSLPPPNWRMPLNCTANRAPAKPFI
ncbi:hypothetical protein [Methylomonas koyamae]|uniref:hypothetical protein n=1 Tax=Methylomonas koyamae TaxID=702114 RepID=UPI0012F663E5|nr:hypothetical protein [Methylomonas koyamae]